VGASCFALCLAGCGGVQRPETRLPSLELDRLDGSRWNLRDEAGRIVLLEFFATFDNSSIALATSLERLHVTYRHRGVSVIGVAMDPPNAQRRYQVVEAFCALNNLTFDVVLASEELGRGQTAVGVIPMIPATVIFDREGRPVASATGIFRREEVESLLDALVAGGSHPLLEAALPLPGASRLDQP
jgi:peroxiredoxin